jgi:hypothetical protein
MKSKDSWRYSLQNASHPQEHQGDVLKSSVGVDAWDRLRPPRLDLRMERFENGPLSSGAAAIATWSFPA